nr:RecQ-mediated genome instability protein 2 [Tanacetum cinerariifolium]
MVVVSVIALGISVRTVLRIGVLLAVVVFVAIVVCGGIWLFVLCVVCLSFKVHKIVDLSAFPHREAMWYLEVLEAYMLFYQSSIEEDLLTSKN